MKTRIRQNKTSHISCYKNRKILDKSKNNSNSNNKVKYVNDLIYIDKSEYGSEYTTLIKLIDSNLVMDCLVRYNVVLAGGCINSLFTNAPVHDLDLYFSNIDDLLSFVSDCYMAKRMTSIHLTDKSITFKAEDIIYQCIYFKYFDNIKDIFNSFDFTVCMGAFDFRTGKFVFDKNFFRDVAKRNLVFNMNTDYPIVSELRIEKYINKGYTISNKERLKILFSVSQLEINDYKSFKSHIGGMYGSSFNDSITLNDDEEFSMELMINKLDKVDEIGNENLDNGLFTIYTRDDLWETLHLINKKRKIFKIVNRFYEVMGNSISEFYPTDEDLKECELINPNEYFHFPITKYKYVYKDNDNRYYSFWDKSFEYRVGEYVTGKSLYSVDGCDIDNCSYCNENNHVLLRLRVDSVQDVVMPYMSDFSMKNFVAKKYFVEKVYSEEEEKALRERCRDRWLLKS